MHYPDFAPEKINFFLDLGGLGDNIARLPAIKYITERHPHVQEIVWVADYFYDLAKNMLPNVNFKKYSQNKDYDEKLPARSTGNKAFQNLKVHMTDHAFYLLASELPSVEHRNYLKLNTNSISINKFNLPKNYVVVTTGFTAPIREFLPEYINTVCDYIISKGYKIVFLGNEQIQTGIPDDNIKGHFKSGVNYHKGINLINKTNLLEAGKIISKAKTIVGLDNGLLHLAACTDIPIVGSFTSVDPMHRIPYRNNIIGHNFYPIVPPDSEPEKFCQSRWDFCFEHDFKFSYYNNDSLIKSVTSDLYIKELEKIL